MIRLSVVIPTRDRARLLERTLGSLLQQTYSNENFEVIVVDNGSTDHTRQAADRFKSLFSHFEYVYEPAPGLHVGRHAGLKAAEGEILVYGDDDITAFPTWLAGVEEAFNDERVVLAGGNILPDFEIEPPGWVESLWQTTAWGRVIYPYSVLNFGQEVIGIPPEFVWGCNFSIRRSVLLEAGGFNPDSMPADRLRYRGDGETAVSIKIKEIGGRAVFNPRASVYHLVSKERMTLDYLYKRGFQQGISDSYTDIRNRGGINQGAGIRNSVLKLRSWLRNTVKKDSEPWKNFRAGYLDGYLYHQAEVLGDIKLQSWVLKETYLDW